MPATDEILTIAPFPAAIIAGRAALVQNITLLRFNAKDAQTTINAIEAERGQAFFTFGDVTDEQAVNNWMQAILDRHGRIDILINNVGQSERLGPADADTNIWRDQLALNLDSVMFCTRAALPAMIAAGKGAIVNISSVAGIFGVYIQPFNNSPLTGKQPGNGTAVAGLVLWTAESGHSGDFPSQRKGRCPVHIMLLFHR